MSFTDLQKNIIKSLAEERSVDPVKMLVFIEVFSEVESAGQAFATVDGKSEPLIRYEGHYMLKLVPQNKKQQAIREGLAGAYGVVKNPSSQQKRYELLARAKRVDVSAAISSCSWGIGQVMGSHWQALGYESATDLEQRVRKNFRGQVELMVRFMANSGILPHLVRGDWSACARIYNGPDYKKNAYDTKLEAAYKKLTGAKTAPKSSSMVRAGSMGEAVREVQTLLRRAGYAVDVDGDFGPTTQKATVAFQTAHNLEADGVVGPLTLQKLYEFKQSVEESPGRLSAMDVPQVRNGLFATVGSLVGFEVIQTKLDGLIEKTSAVPGLELLTTALTIGSVLAVLGGIVYTIYNLTQANKTDLGT